MSTFALRYPHLLASEPAQEKLLDLDADIARANLIVEYLHDELRRFVVELDNLHAARGAFIESLPRRG